MFSIDDINAWNTASADAKLAGPEAEGAEIYANWQTGVSGLYMNNDDFKKCMEPFDEYSFDYTYSEQAMAKAIQVPRTNHSKSLTVNSGSQRSC